MLELPVAWANPITAVAFLVLLGLCFVIPRKQVLADAPDQRRWRDLRWWAVALIVVQLSIYQVFT